MNRKFQFYQEYRVEEYYIFDPDRIRLDGWIRTNDTLLPIPDMTGWTSPLLKIRFELAADDLVIYCPDGTRFLSTLELDEISKSNQRKAESERLRAEAAIRREKSERQRAEAAIQREAFERREKERLSARLRELGIDI